MMVLIRSLCCTRKRLRTMEQSSSVITDGIGDIKTVVNAHGKRFLELDERAERRHEQTKRQCNDTEATLKEIQSRIEVQERHDERWSKGKFLEALYSLSRL